jgi:hypothetical protein
MGDRDEIHARRLRAVHGEVVDLTVVGPPRRIRVPVVTVCARHGEQDRALAKPSCLALDASESTAIIDDEVVACVLAERDKERITRCLQSEHRRERRPVADLLRMFHTSSLVVISDNIPLILVR